MLIIHTSHFTSHKQKYVFAFFNAFKCENFSFEFGNLIFLIQSSKNYAVIKKSRIQSDDSSDKEPFRQRLRSEVEEGRPCVVPPFNTQPRNLLRSKDYEGHRDSPWSNLLDSLSGSRILFIPFFALSLIKKGEVARAKNIVTEHLKFYRPERSFQLLTVYRILMRFLLQGWNSRHDERISQANALLRFKEYTKEAAENEKAKAKV